MSLIIYLINKIIEKTFIEFPKLEEFSKGGVKNKKDLEYEKEYWMNIIE